MSLYKTIAIAALLFAGHWWLNVSSKESDSELTTIVQPAKPTISVPSVQAAPNPFSITADASSDASGGQDDAYNDITQTEGPQALIFNKNCADSCREILELIEFAIPITDEEFENALGESESLADYLRHNPQMIQVWIDMAAYAKGNKRSLIIATFSQLETQDQQSLGQALIQSQSFAHRMDGVKLLARQDEITEDQVHEFAHQLINESNNHVRSALVSALVSASENSFSSVPEQSERLLNLEPIFASLDHVRENDADYAVRGEALLATVGLHEHPQLALEHTLSAIHSDIGLYQEYGAQALQAIVMRQSQDGLTFNTSQQQALSDLKDNLMHPDFDGLPQLARDIIDNL